MDHSLALVATSGFLPGAEGLFDGIADGCHLDADAGEFGGGHDAVRARGFCGEFHELVFAGEELVLLRVDAAFFDEGDNFAGSDVAGIGDVVDAEGDAFFPAGEGGGDELVELRNGVLGFEEFCVAHQLGEVVARAVDVIEGDAEAPDVDVGFSGEDFFAEGFGAAVEGAVVGAEAEVGRIGFGEAGAVGAGAGVDAAGGDVAPGDAGFGAGLGDEAGEDGVAEEALGFVKFAGVDVGLAGVAGGVDEELGFVGLERGGEDGGVGVVHIRAAEIAEGNVFAGEEGLVCLADVAGAAEKIDHE